MMDRRLVLQDPVRCSQQSGYNGEIGHVRFSPRRPAPQMLGIFCTSNQAPPFDPARNFKLDDRRAPTPQKCLPRPKVKGGKDVGLGWGSDVIKQAWKGGTDPRTKKTNPDGLMVQSLMDEVTKYGDFAQLVYPNFIHFGAGNPQIADPSKLLPEACTRSGDTANEPSWIAKSSPIFDHDILEDDRYYLEATSGVYKGEFGYGTRLLRKYLPAFLAKLKGGENNAPQSKNWIGYVAVSKPLKDRNNERDLVVVFRGTQAKAEWVSNMMTGMVQWSELQIAGPDIKVEQGFEEIYRRFDSTPGNTISIQGQVHVAVRTLLAKYGSDPSKGAITTISTTGHSLGGALASMCAFDLAWSKIGCLGDKQDGDLIPITAFTFEAPRVGNEAFAKVFETQSSLGTNFQTGQTGQEDLKYYVPLKSLRVINLPDVVPREPCFPLSPRYLWPWLWWKGIRFTLGSISGLLIPDARGDWYMGYRHGGQEYAVNTETIWPRTPLTSVDKWWWPPNVFSWWLSRIGDMHSLQLPLYLVDPSRGKRSGNEKAKAA